MTASEEANAITKTPDLPIFSDLDLTNSPADSTGHTRLLSRNLLVVFVPRATQPRRLTLGEHIIKLQVNHACLVLRANSPCRHDHYGWFLLFKFPPVHSFSLGFEQLVVEQMAGMRAEPRDTHYSQYPQDMQCVENCSDPNPANHVLYEQPVWQTLQMFRP